MVHSLSGAERGACLARWPDLLLPLARSLAHQVVSYWSACTQDAELSNRYAATTWTHVAMVLTNGTNGQIHLAQIRYAAAARWPSPCLTSGRTRALCVTLPSYAYWMLDSLCTMQPSPGVKQMS